MTEPVVDPLIPDLEERQALNTALLRTGAETGFWDDSGRPAVWPDDIAEWRPTTGAPTNPDADAYPF